MISSNIKKLYKKIRKINIFDSIYNYCQMKINRIQTTNIQINGRIIISCECMNISKIKLPTIFIGKGTKINSGYKYNLIGAGEKTILRTVDNGTISIGRNVGMSNVSIVAHCMINIGNDVIIGGGVKIYDSDFHSLKYEERIKYPDYNINSAAIQIEDGAFIGADSIILKGVTIGKQSVIGAGSVVTRNVPTGQIWGGAPAKYIKDIG